MSDKYSLGYAICNSIQENKDKIEKLENQLKRCRRKKEQVENKCGDYKSRIDKAINSIDILQEIIYQQPADNAIDDLWLLDKLDGFKYILRGESNE